MQNDRDDRVRKLATRVLRHPFILASTSLALIAVIALAWAASAFADNGLCDVYVTTNTT